MVRKQIEKSGKGSSKDSNAMEDDTTTVAPTVTFSRNNGSFTMNTEAYNYLDDASTMFNGRMHALDTSSHQRRLSNDRLVSSQLSQWNYNNNRVLLDRAILHVKSLLQEISMENEKRPISIRDVENELKVLQLNFKLDGEESKDINLGRESYSKLFDSQIRRSLKHLESLQKRVDDISSKVFITGDVNTGKSAFCNSLLRRNLLPEDQLPCTNVFCEILDARENDGIEEVHAISIGTATSIQESLLVYNIRDRSTYEIYPLSSLPGLVTSSNKYALLKVYINDDNRPPEKSLLRNGTVNISLIDSPGLNMDSVQTSEVMARQEEIDLVVFVVNAENQLTLSAKEFILLASREKKLMFFVVKKFDKIRDKERCKRLILQQIKDLSPESYKKSSEFIHFINNDDDDDGDDGDVPGSDDEPDGTDDENNSDPNFDNLENSLRDFILKRRSLSKLFPAKTYVLKILTDIERISIANLKIYDNENEKIEESLHYIEQELYKKKSQYEKFTSNIDSSAEKIITSTYNFAESRIANFLDIANDGFPKYEGFSKIYDFIVSTEEYIRRQIKDSTIASEDFAKKQTEKAVEQIYKQGREALGNEFMSDRVFDSSLMFTRKHHLSARELSIPLSISDLFAPSLNNFLTYVTGGLFTSYDVSEPYIAPQIAQDEEDSNGGVVSTLGLKNYPLTQYWKTPSLLFTSNLPAFAIYSFGGSKIISNVIINGISSISAKSLELLSGYLLLGGCLLSVSYLIHDLPRALPLNLSAKYRSKLDQLNYMHQNATRISKEVRNVLKIPIREMSRTCDSLLDREQDSIKKLEKKKQDNKISFLFFNQLLERAKSQKTIIEKIDLDVD
ncbi:hypothetical protein KAFR_0I00690 [Kazachstania africana CBS 2517]|uniref:Dynamin-type G domain-containing protein n=1 Tax=Kazachstania africana (strain ATCC 22294 / BCRC 22015 / CBS 2517 / CECT 1963 / NBRC 1671 / NRRL Y-8276) TaxID=1071382 RepID=H2AZQ0_KAZAF|nr:hypothetical protein KAFR_0I00690 [Kazachstania africana CBS 2517]CCF59850.1 hypothetical protein KAFR_0I00690 [Kazachstania africana CBS 2517]